MLGSASMVRGLASAALAAVLALALTDASAIAFGLGATEPLPLGLRGLWDAIVMVSSGQGTYALLLSALAALGVATLAELGAALSAWFLLPRRLRAGTWVAVDLALLAAFVSVTLLLPIAPPASAPSAWQLPALRLAVTALAATRGLYRGIPWVLDLVEGRPFGTPLDTLVLGNFRLLVASRLLRARKSGFLTAIGGLSILAVAFSSCTLTTTLSVMGGFRNDLKRKILGNHGNVVIDREHGTIDAWEPTLEAVRAHDDVVAATPYVQGEVMITSATNLAGAVLRGIDPASIGLVTELPRNMRHGQLRYLDAPEELLRLRNEEMNRALLAPSIVPDALTPPIPELPTRDALPDAPAGFLDDAEDVLEPPPSTDQAERDRIAREIDEFLLTPEELAARPPTGPAPPAADPPSIEGEVLPGLVVGQELARSLRLHVGDEVDVVSPLGELGPSGPIPKTRPFRIAGIFYSGMYEFDMKMAYTTVADAQRFLNVDDAIHGIEVKVRDAERAEPVARTLDEAIGREGVRVRAWQEVNRNLFGALQLEKLAMFITLGIAILVASFCVVGSLTLMVQEKRKEVGILKAMGATGAQVVAVFMAQGLMIGLLGAALGLGLGYVTCFAAEHFGLPLNPEVYYIDRLPVHVDSMEFVLVGVAAVIICLLATIYPALLGSRLRPIDALRYT
jgi:lipoprotein-releasing system permease protein